MALTYGFFNSLKGDRKYNAEQVSELFDGILKDGIIPSQGQLFAVTTANNGMQINVGTGRAWFDHTWTKNDSVKVLTVPQSDITRDRWDAVVLEVNHSEDVRANDIKIVSGTAAVNPVKPAMVSTDKVHQYPLAYIKVKAAAETILAENIENAVGLEPTVFATGILETVPLNDLWEQWKGEWTTWFSAIKLQLSGDIVTNLQLQIEELRDYVTISTETLNEYDLPSTSSFDTIMDNIYKRFRMIMIDKALITVKIKYDTGKPASGLSFSAITDEDGTPAVSDKNGVLSGYISEGSATLSISGYADIVDFSETLEIIKGDTYLREITLQTRNFQIFNASKNIKFSQNVDKISYTLCGAGGGGGEGGMDDDHPSSAKPSGGGGGGGGYSIEVKNVSVIPNTEYRLELAGSTSGAGGSSSFDGNVANGGSHGASGRNYSGSLQPPGGAGNGAGGNGASTDESSGSWVGRPAGAGGSGNGVWYTSFTETGMCGGGGGGGGSKWSSNGGAGGTPNGASGGEACSVIKSGSFPATAYGGNGSFPGGGGGGSGGNDYRKENSLGRVRGGYGGGGGLAIRMYLK